MKGCKKCPAFAKCMVIYRSSACEALRGTYGIDTDPEIKTNADRIRSMTNEELANFIPNWSYTNACKCGEHYVDCNNECEKCVTEWLHQPAEED